MVFLHSYTRNSFFCSQFTVGVAMFVASISNGTFSGWINANVATFRSEDSPVPMNNEQLSWVVSVSFLGTLLSSLPIGLLMDRSGHKVVLLSASVLLPVTSLLLTRLTTHWKLLLVARVLCGMWSGVVNTIAPLYLSEIAEPEVRGCMNTMFNVAHRLGSIATVLVSFVFSYEDLPVVLMLIPMCFLGLSLVIPESPHFYLRRKDLASARRSLTWLRNGRTDQEIELELSGLNESIRRYEEEHSGESLTELFCNPSTRRALLIVETLSLFQRLTSLTSIISYLSVTLPKNVSIHTNVLVTVIEVFRLIGGLASSLTIDKIGNRVLLIASSLVCSFLLFTTASWYIVYHSTNAPPDGPIKWLPFLCITLHSIIYSFGFNPVCCNIKSEFFPLSIKGKCSALTSAVVALANFLMSKVYLDVSETLGLYFNFVTYGVFSLLTFAFANRFLIETKGKTLQEIQNELDRTVRKKSEPLGDG